MLFYKNNFCVFVLTHSRIFPSFQVETSSLPVKGCKCLGILGTYGHRAVRVLEGDTPNVSRDIREWDSNTQPSVCGANALHHCDTVAYFSIYLV